MTTLFVSPHLIDSILVFTLVEAIFLFVWLRSRSSSPRRLNSSTPDAENANIVTIGLMLLPGICLMLATRAALAGAAWPWVPLTLVAALLAHLLDLRRRWRG